MTKQKHFYLFRGLIREAGHWGDFPDLLQKAITGTKVTMIDIPGAGIYYQSPSPLSVKEMVKKMRQEFLKTRDSNDEPILLAISLGGMIAAQWLKDYPQDFRKAILINTSYGGMSGLFERLKLSALIHLLRVPLLKGRKKESHILKLVSNNLEKFENTLKLWEEIQKLRPVSTINSIRQLTAAGRFKIGDFIPSIPILLLVSTQDRMVSSKCSHAIAKKWQAKLIEHPTAGHDLSCDEPEWIVEQVKNFVVNS